MSESSTVEVGMGETAKLAANPGLAHRMRAQLTELMKTRPSAEQASRVRRTVAQVAQFAGGILDEDQLRAAAGAVVPQARRNRHLELSRKQQLAVTAARSPGLRAFWYGPSRQSSK